MEVLGLVSISGPLQGENIQSHNLFSLVRMSLSGGPYV